MPKTCCICTALLKHSMLIHTGPTVTSIKAAGSNLDNVALMAQRLVSPVHGSPDLDPLHCSQALRMRPCAEGVQWLRVDPQGETLTRAHVWQPERTWILQLEASHEAAAQHEAVTALAALPNPSHAAVAALRACLLSDTMFCRCRAPDCPLTLASSTSCFHLQIVAQGAGCRCIPAVMPRQA